MVQVYRSKPKKDKWMRMVMQKRRFRGQDVALVEFKAPRRLVEDFDSAWRSRYYSRSEAIRYLMRAFVEASKGVNVRKKIGPKNEH